MTNIFKRVVYKLDAIIKDQAVCKYLAPLQHHEQKDKIRVGFIVQMAEVWDKEVDVYDKMLSRDNIDVIMLVVPHYDFNKKKIIISYENNYFLSKYPEAIRAMDEDGYPIDVKKLNLDYVFFQRPYDFYLPKGLRSCDLVKYTRCCYIPYGYNGSYVFNNGSTNRNFFRNIYFAFMESEYMKQVVYLKYRTNCEKGYQHFEYLGYPVLESYLKIPPTNIVKKVIWTPRWSNDSTLGGSHFMDYKNYFLSIRNCYPQLNLIFRPHPLMFEELLRTNLMSEIEISNYTKFLCEQGIYFDQGQPIEDALKSADLMITDYSSVIIMFFLTGRPIIYCESNIEFSGLYKEMKPYLYIANNQSELDTYLNDILNGNDYMRERRMSFIKERFTWYERVDKRIVDRIVEDYFN